MKRLEGDNVNDPGGLTTTWGFNGAVQWQTRLALSEAGILYDEEKTSPPWWGNATDQTKPTAPWWDHEKNAPRDD